MGHLKDVCYPNCQECQWRRLHYGSSCHASEWFQFQGKVYIALDEGSDYYRIYGEKDGTTKEYHHDIAFDELGDVLDLMIETGGMTKEEYQAKVKDFVCSL